MINASIATPPSAASALSNQPLPALAARLGAWVARWLGRPVRIGSRVIVVRYDQVHEALARDLEFRIAPVNADKIDAVNGPFVLGMDRDVTLGRERAALYQALAQVDMTPLRDAADIESAAWIAKAGVEIDVVDGYARPIAAQTAKSLFGIDPKDDPAFMDVARAVFNQIFLNLGDDEAVAARALDASRLMHAWFSQEIAARRQSGVFGSDMMGALMTAGLLDDDGVRRTLGGMLVGSIDTTASSVAKIVAMIGRDPVLASGIARDVDHPNRMAGWCWEALRRWPHNPILLRRATVATQLAGVAVQPGDQVYVWTQAAMLDASVFPDPHHLNPNRPPASYLHFGGGLHPCAGRVVNDFQIPLLVGALVRRGIKSVGAVQWAGPFPAHLPVRFHR